MIYVLLFFLGLVYDALLVLWSYYVDRKLALRAGLASAAVVAVGLFGTRFSLQDWGCFWADVLGCGLGTYFMVKWKNVT